MINLKSIIKETKAVSESGKNTFSLQSLKVESGFEVNYATGKGTFETTKIIVPEKIEIDKTALIAFGLLQAETTKKPNYATFDFTNANPALVEFFLVYWERAWNQPRTKWKARILLWNRNELEKARNFWKEKLKIETDIQRGTAYRISDSASENGVCHLLFANKTLRAIVLRVHEKIKQEILTDRKKAIAYLSGLLAGDGSVVSEGGKATIELCLNMNSDEPEFYGKILESLGLEITEADKRLYDKKRYIRVGGYKNLLKLLLLSEAELFLPDKTKNKKFLKALFHNQYLKPFFRIKEFKNIFTAREYAEKFGVVKRTANANIARLIKQGLVERQHSKEYTISTEGEKLVEIVEKARNIIAEN